jgi:uncharacterized protein
VTNAVRAAVRPGRWIRRAAGCLWFGVVPALALPVAPPVGSAGASACPPSVLAPHALVSALVSAPVPARDRGLLWRLQRDGRTSWLYGTLHLGRPAWGAPGPQVKAALRASQWLALEVDPDDPDLSRQIRQRAPAAGPTPAPADLPAQAALPVTLVQRLHAAVARACLPASAMPDWPPLLQAAALTVLDARWLGLDPAFGLDRQLADLARARGLPVLGLERAEAQLRALQPSNALALQAQLNQALQQLESGSARRALAQLALAWESGDIDRLSAYEAWCECAPTDEDRELLRRLNDDRNPGLVAGIEALHRRGLAVFAAVGALHMTGPASLPALLAARGFRVDRVAFSPPGRTMGKLN